MREILFLNYEFSIIAREGRKKGLYFNMNLVVRDAVK